jgi:hypothetical protein
LEIERSRDFGGRLAAIDYAANSLDLKFTRVLPPLFCHGHHSSRPRAEAYHGVHETGARP